MPQCSPSTRKQNTKNKPESNVQNLMICLGLSETAVLGALLGFRCHPTCLRAGTVPVL
jgi:hypothetical protein